MLVNSHGVFSWSSASSNVCGCSAVAEAGSSSWRNRRSTQPLRSPSSTRTQPERLMPRMATEVWASSVPLDGPPGERRRFTSRVMVAITGSGEGSKYSSSSSSWAKSGSADRRMTARANGRRMDDLLCL